MSPPTVLITGGAGFIGANLADRLASEARRVRIVDNLSRGGVERNLAWLDARHRGAIDVVIGDVRDPRVMDRAMDGVSEVYHLAAQVAVTTSLVAPREDFDVNAGGTLCVLEAARARDPMPSVVYTSTNKVYGALGDVVLEDTGERHQPADPELAARGVGEDRALDFHSPYGCSKGAADQYVRDYARSYGMATVVLRMSCVYGPRQLGNEDQGWVAHFVRRALAGEAMSIYGDGRQVRDLLYVDDLVAALRLAQRHAERRAGQAFNIGGGPRNAASVIGVLARAAALAGVRPAVAFGPWRTGDQRWYVSDTRRFAATTGWEPRVGVDEGVARLAAWARELQLPAAAFAEAM